MSRYLVRGKKGARDVYAYGPGMGFGDACEEIPAHAFERLDAAAGARDHMVKLGCEASIFRVHPDGREERLPSYEEALAEIERLRAIEALMRTTLETFARFESGGERPSRGELGEMCDAMRTALRGSDLPKRRGAS